jgi:UDP-glucose 4-epimerase
MRVLVTGGCGFIGSHAVVELLDHVSNSLLSADAMQGYEVVIIDNLVNSSVTVLDRIEKISNKRPVFREIDLRDSEAIERVFSEFAFDGVIHFAGLKAVGESVQKPLLYYQVNITGTLNLLQVILRSAHALCLKFLRFSRF